MQFATFPETLVPYYPYFSFVESPYKMGADLTLNEKHDFMTVIDTLTSATRPFADSRFSADLKIMPLMKTMVIGCVDPHVDPADILVSSPVRRPSSATSAVESPRQRSR